MGINEKVELTCAVNENEMLYRVIKRSKPEHLSPDLRPMPGLFKDPEGVSVDRDAGRSESDIISFMLDNFGKRAKGIGKVSARYCFKVDANVKPVPTEANPYHANIMLSEDEKRRNVQALQLADNSQIVYYDARIRWI